MKRFFSLLATVLLLIGSACGKAAPVEPVYHTDLTFSELTGSGEDAGLEIARARELLFRIERGELNGERAQAALDARTEAYQKLTSDAALAYVQYCLDVTNEENKQRYDALSVQLDTLGALLVDAALLLSKDPAISDRYDAETVEALRGQYDAVYLATEDSGYDRLFREAFGEKMLVNRRNSPRSSGPCQSAAPVPKNFSFICKIRSCLKNFSRFLALRQSHCMI